MGDTKELTSFNRGLRRNRYYCTTMTFKTFSRYAYALTPILGSFFSRKMRERRYGCSPMLE